ncbi:hypothetical protein GCM10022252_78580 [Streptosporangium oxazolinicum]|uniref:Uncharacterized protein n=2 Tax=Streptosporangium oxazolinicum TaxID=909287 RepID=A0ABP8BMW7_9ACTN
MATLKDFLDTLNTNLIVKLEGDSLGLDIYQEDWSPSSDLERIRLILLEDRVGPLLRHKISEDGLEVRHISMNSPLTLELVIGGLTSASLISAVVYLFKNPDKLGEWWPKLQTSWYNGRAEAERARKAYDKLRRARTQVRELER